jgi:geranylgeranyl pyrophosphate synthase
VTLLDESGARHYATTEAERYTAAAIANLDAAAPTGSAAFALRQLTDLLLRRDA